MVRYETPPAMTRLAAQLFGALLLVGLVLHYIWWILAGIAAWYVWQHWSSIEAWTLGQWQAREAAHAAERKRLADIVARADQQHQQVLSGDERGLWGISSAAMKEFERVSHP
jgi:hypothetical protein